MDNNEENNEEDKEEEYGDEEGEEDEENKSHPPVARKVIDQSKSNIPIVNPDFEELKELLEQNAIQL